MTTILSVMAAMTPVLVTVGLLRLADRIQFRREASYARQIELTDAIHRELGAVVAPTVRRRLWRGWLVSMRVPFDRPAMVAAILRVTDELFGSGGRSAIGFYQIVLTRQPKSPGPESSGARRPAVEKPARMAA